MRPSRGAADDVARFITAAQADPLYPAFMLLVLYGLRRGEVLGLRWCDVNWSEHGCMFVSNSNGSEEICDKARSRPRPRDAMSRFWTSPPKS